MLTPEMIDGFNHFLFKNKAKSYKCSLCNWTRNVCCNKKRLASFNRVSQKLSAIPAAEAEGEERKMAENIPPVNDIDFQCEKGCCILCARLVLGTLVIYFVTLGIYF